MNTLHDNRWHNSEYPDNLLKAGYIEWKYFNFTTPDFSGIFVYLIADPLNITGIGGGRVIARIFTRDGVVGGVCETSIKDVSSSNENAGIDVGDNSIIVRDDAYIIKGKVSHVTWNLKYSPLAPLIQGFSDLSVDPFNFEKISWLIKMPKANVIGTIKIKGKEFDIDTMGYSDANWGELVPVVVRLDWAQYNDDSVSVVVGEVENLNIGKKKFGRWSEIYAIYQNELITFTRDVISIEHLEWTTIPDSKIEIPLVTKVRAENEIYKLDLVLKTKLSDPIYFNTPFYLPIEQVVVEQVASFSGGLSKKEGAGFTILHSIEGTGFKEYTLRDVSIRKKNTSTAGVVAYGR